MSSRSPRQAAVAIPATEVKERLFSTGVQVVGSSPESFSQTLKADIERIGKLIRTTGLKAE